MDTKKIAILAGLGIAVYYLTMRRATAAVPNGVRYVPGQPAMGPAVMPRSPTSGNLFGALGSLFNTTPTPQTPKTQYYDYQGNPAAWSAGDSAAGEAAAQQYYIDNRDLFAANPPSGNPSDYPLSGYVTTGGWADSQ